MGASRVQLAATADDAAAGKAIALTAGAEGSAHLLAAVPVPLTFDPATQVALQGAAAGSNTITLGTDHDLKTGDRVVYTVGTGGKAIGGLKDGATYYVIAVDARRVQLCATRADADAGKPRSP